MEFAKWLRERRGLTGQRGLAAAARGIDPGCGIHQPAIWSWEAGRSAPTLRQLVALCGALEVDEETAREGEALWRVTQLAPVEAAPC